MKKKAATKKLPASGKLSAALKTFITNMEAPSITVGELCHAFSGRSYGILIFILALPNLIPLPTPGLSAVVGAPLILITGQLMFGLNAPWLPKFIANKKFKRAGLQKSFKRVEKYLKALEYVMKPRIHILVGPVAQRLVAVVCFAMSVMIMLPLPFGNAFPAFAICLLAMAILMKDGLFVILGLLSAAASAAIVLALVTGVVSSVESLLGF